MEHSFLVRQAICCACEHAFNRLRTPKVIYLDSTVEAQQQRGINVLIFTYIGSLLRHEHTGVTNRSVQASTVVIYHVIRLLASHQLVLWCWSLARSTICHLRAAENAQDAKPTAGKQSGAFCHRSRMKFPPLKSSAQTFSVKGNKKKVHFEAGTLDSL